MPQSKYETQKYHAMYFSLHFWTMIFVSALLSSTAIIFFTSAIFNTDNQVISYLLKQTKTKEKEQENAINYVLAKLY